MSIDKNLSLVLPQNIYLKYDIILCLRYNVNKLVCYEVYDDVKKAIRREKQIKAGSRQKKINLIKRTNSLFKDLYSDL